MPNKRDDWLRRIKAVSREYDVTRFALDRLIEATRRDPTVLQKELSVRATLIASNNLEATYMIRLFAEFETGLRNYWGTSRATHPMAHDLLDGAAAKRAISQDALKNAHTVREYRNLLVHDRDDDPTVLAIATARSFLCTYFSRLPLTW